jgi:hypothetical protein
VDNLLRAARAGAALGLLASVAGLLVLVASATSEVLANPSLTLADGYWIGRLPWTAVGVDLAIIGATVAIVLGALTATLAGGLVRRVICAAAAAVAVGWWLFALQPSPGGAFCAACPPPGPDPVTSAYSLPEAAVLLLLLPAAIVGVLALTADRTRGSVAATSGVAVE